MSLKLIEQSQPSAVASHGTLYVDSATGLLRFRESTGFGSDDIQISQSEGSWTPTFVGSSTPGTFTYTVQEGIYTRAGNLIFIAARVTISAISVAPVGNMQINGLPFTVRNEGTANKFAVAFSVIDNFNYTATAIELTGVFARSQTFLNLFEAIDNAAVAAVTGANFTNANCSLSFSGWYRV